MRAERGVGFSVSPEATAVTFPETWLSRRRGGGAGAVVATGAGAKA